jgi:hypothetical protein
MCAEKPAGVRDGTEVFALGGFTETLGGIQAGILKVRVRAPDCDTNPECGYVPTLAPLMTAHGTKPTSSDVRSSVANGGKPDIAGIAQFGRE